MRIAVFFIFFFVFAGTAQNRQDSLRIESLLLKANSKMDKGDYENALNGFLYAIEESKKKGNPNLIFKSKVSLGNFFIMTGKPQRAGEIFESVMPYQTDSDKLKCTYYHRKAFYFNAIKHQTDSAAYYSQKALEIARKHGYKSEQETIHNELGNINEQTGNFKEAMEHYKMALLFSEKNTADYHNIKKNIASNYYNLGKLDDCIATVKTILNADRGNESPSLNAQVNNLLYKAYIKSNDSLKAYQHLYEAERYHNIIIKSNYEKNYNELLIAFKTQEKEEELQQSKTRQHFTLLVLSGIIVILLGVGIFSIVITKKNKKLNTYLGEKEFLLSEVNHRIKNNLQLITSLISFETSKNNTNTLDGLADIASKIESIASLYQQLYTDNKVSLIGLDSYLNEIILNLMPFFNACDISIHSNFTPADIKSDKALYIGLIINELAINSIKYAFTGLQDKKIEIRTFVKDNYLTLHYFDNGTGIKPGMQPKLVSILASQLKTEFKFAEGEHFNFNLKIKI